MDKARFRYLFSKHTSAKLTESEHNELIRLMTELDGEAVDEIVDEILSPSHRTERTSIPSDRKKLIFQRINHELAGGRRSRTAVNTYIAAAAAVMLAVAAIVAMQQRQLSESASDVLTPTVSGNIEDILLPSDHAPIIRLANGDTHAVDPRAHDLLRAAGVKINSDAQGTLYQLQQQERHGHAAAATPWLVFSSPRGQTSRLMLADGSVVWLNSGSSLSYPARFDANERHVSLQGEAFFDVATMPNAPFIINANNLLINVLGTSFNVAAYQDEQSVTTTLVKGSVKLVNATNEQLMLLPGEQAVAHIDGRRMEKQQVDVNEYTTWKDGYFNFNGQSIPEILHTVKRWYEIEDITFEVMPEKRFSGTFKRTKSLKSLLDKLEKVSQVKFRITEGRVVVME